MARIEPVYRHHDAGSDTATSGSLACVVSGLPERNLDDIADRYCHTLRTATPDSQHNNRRTGETRFNPNHTPGRVESRNVPLPDSKHHSRWLNMSAFADVNVSAFVEIPGQHLLTYPRRDPEEAIRILTNTANPILNTLNQNRTPPA